MCYSAVCFSTCHSRQYNTSIFNRLISVVVVVFVVFILLCLQIGCISAEQVVRIVTTQHNTYHPVVLYKFCFDPKYGNIKAVVNTNTMNQRFTIYTEQQWNKMERLSNTFCLHKTLLALYSFTLSTTQTNSIAISVTTLLSQHSTIDPNLNDDLKQQQPIWLYFTIMSCDAPYLDMHSVFQFTNRPIVSEFHFSYDQKGIYYSCIICFTFFLLLLTIQVVLFIATRLFFIHLKKYTCFTYVVFATTKQFKYIIFTTLMLSTASGCICAQIVLFADNGVGWQVTSYMYPYIILSSLFQFLGTMCLLGFFSYIYNIRSFINHWIDSAFFVALASSYLPFLYDIGIATTNNNYRSAIFFVDNTFSAYVVSFVHVMVAFYLLFAVTRCCRINNHLTKQQLFLALTLFCWMFIVPLVVLLHSFVSPLLLTFWMYCLHQFGLLVFFIFIIFALFAAHHSSRSLSESSSSQPHSDSAAAANAVIIIHNPSISSHQSTVTV